MANFTLDDIRTAADKKFGSCDIEISDGETVVLLNPLRLNKDRRTKLLALQDKMSSDKDDEDEDKEEHDIEAILDECILLVAEKPALGKKLLKEIGEDLAVKMGVFEKFMGGTEVGEASPSQD